MDKWAWVMEFWVYLPLAQILLRLKWSRVSLNRGGARTTMLTLTGICRLAFPVQGR